MRPILLLLALIFSPLAFATAPAATAVAPTGSAAAPVYVALDTRLGRVLIELDPVRAPLSVANFLAYVDAGHYNGTIFHRVVPNLLVQGGAFTPDLQAKPERAPIPNEAGNGLSNLRGTVAAARRPDTIDSAGAQFFINVVDNPQFDQRDPSQPATAGYAVFGRVVEGMAVIDRMREVETTAAGPFPSRVPTTPIIIERAARAEAPVSLPPAPLPRVDR